MTLTPESAPFVYSDSSAEEALRLAKRLPQHSTASYKEALTYPGYQDAEVHYIICEEDQQGFVIQSIRHKFRHGIDAPFQDHQLTWFSDMRMVFEMQVFESLQNENNSMFCNKTRPFTNGRRLSIAGQWSITQLQCVVILLAGR